ncbi:hypothetical protein M3Y99_00902300 [Aphelenchoides fujianensis]|nr:hypothetical protein M3Y99_00902300 [Aphelenchoides fujianensis]
MDANDLDVLWVLTLVACVKWEFVQIPTGIRPLVEKTLKWKRSTTVEGCASLIGPTDYLVSYTPSTQNCTTKSRVLGYNYQQTNNIFYLKMPSLCGQCASKRTALEAILNYAYGNNLCPDTFFTYDTASGYCIAPVSSQASTQSNDYFSNYGAYTQGYYSNKTVLAMSRGQATRALKYSCQYNNATLAVFNGVWYCYTIFPVTAPSNSYILNDRCKTLVAGGSLVQFVHPAEPGFLFAKGGQYSFVGMYLPTGRAATAANYVYLNGSTVPAAYRQLWESGYPKGNRFVYRTQRNDLVR